MSDAKPNLRLVRKMSISRIVDHTPLIRELFITCREPESFQFKAGQFVMLHVPQPEGKPALRAYSLASDERDTGGFRLLFKAVDGGVATKYVWSLKGDETLEFTGPFGRVFFKEPPTEQIVFLNTGSGVSQHYCFLSSMAERYPDLRYRMLFGVRYEHDIYWRAELDALAARLTDFKYEFVVSRPTEAWKGLRGYVQNHIGSLECFTRPTTFYLCGNGAMIKDVKTHLIDENGFDKNMILSEAFD